MCSYVLQKLPVTGTLTFGSFPGPVLTCFCSSGVGGLGVGHRGRHRRRRRWRTRRVVKKAAGEKRERRPPPTPTTFPVTVTTLSLWPLPVLWTLTLSKLNQLLAPSETGWAVSSPATSSSSVSGQTAPVPPGKGGGVFGTVHHLCVEPKPRPRGCISAVCLQHFRPNILKISSSFKFPRLLPGYSVGGRGSASVLLLLEQKNGPVFVFGF